uniref:Uncharacterized protein n=1 Tax=Pithovirus LCPAC404 TaxID=2506597 RepID=A0A481ZDJ9_9VIRU|nr:MAG: uncharacterized protein LCPAC404_02590 [Pithovirus LCPAC404]
MLRVYESEAGLCKNIKPKSIDRTCGGEVVWRDVDVQCKLGKWDRFLIRDIAPFHNKPVPHVDSLFIVLYYPMKINKARQLIDISQSITYLGTAKHIIVGCHFTAAAVGSIVIVKLFNENYIDVKYAIKLYDVVINELYEEFAKTMSLEDQRTGKTPLRDVYERFIFDKCMTFDDLKKKLPSSSSTFKYISNPRSASKSTSTSARTAPRASSSNKSKSINDARRIAAEKRQKRSNSRKSLSNSRRKPTKDRDVNLKSPKLRMSESALGKGSVNVDLGTKRVIVSNSGGTPVFNSS